MKDGGEGSSINLRMAQKKKDLREPPTKKKKFPPPSCTSEITEIKTPRNTVPIEPKKGPISKQPRKMGRLGVSCVSLPGEEGVQLREKR